MRLQLIEGILKQREQLFQPVNCLFNHKPCHTARSVSAKISG